jgi:hypothetical protein
MREICLLLILLFSISCSKRITVIGTAIADTPVRVSINDTLGRILDYDNIELLLKNYKKVSQDKRYVTTTDKNGWFTINPKITDSLSFEAAYHYKKTYAVRDLSKYPYIKLDKIPCEFTGCNDTLNDFYAVVAKKISVKRAEQGYCKDIIRFDSEYAATYQVLENIYGTFTNDTIKFRVFDHYGEPAFEEYDTVLIYITEACDVLYHVKYQYAPLYRTKDGRWASPYSIYYYTRATDTDIKPQVIDFEKEVSFDLKGVDSEWIKINYPEPFYKINGNKAIAVYGNYVENMFILAKPVLKGFGINPG